jgi:hypothetical protein
VQLVMSGLVLVAGVFVALIGDASAQQRVFGWVLIAVGVLGLAAAGWLRRRRTGR